jgi:hypothetical protein
MKRWIKVVSILVLCAMMFSMAGCYGKFSLTKKVYEINGSFGNKWLNTLCFWVFCWLPVYGIAGFADVCFLNVIEFWTGSNPMAMNDGQIERQLIENDGKTFEMVATQNRLDIRQIDDPTNTVSLVFEPTTGEWQLISNGQTRTVATVSGDQLRLIAPDGSVNSMTVGR